ESRLQVRKISLSLLDEGRQLVQLRYADGSLHIRGLEIVAHMRINVLVIIAVRQLAGLPVETLAAGVFIARRTPAIAAPVAKGFDDRAQNGLVGQNASAFAHGDVVRGIEADGCEIAEGAHLLAVVSRAKGIAAVLDQPQAVFLRKCGDGVEIERIPQRVGEDNGAGAAGKRGFELTDIYVVRRNLNIDEDWDECVLQDGIDGGGKSRGQGDDFVAGL